MKLPHVSTNVKQAAIIALGIIAYVVLNLVTGKAKEKKLNLLLYILAIIFIIKECSSLFF